MITPLKGDDQIDREGTVRLTEHILAGGVHALFLLGTTGEAQSLSYECRYDFVELVCRQVAGRVPVLVGVTDTSLDESVKLAAHAAKCGAVAVVAAAPYYFAPSQQELIEYYTALADALPLPLFLYNMPSHVKVFLEPATVKTLAEHPNIVGLKDSSANMTYFQTLLYHLGDREDLSEKVFTEMQLTRKWVLAIVGDEWPLQRRRVLGCAVRVRNPYVDALSIAQVRALREVRMNQDEMAEEKKAEYMSLILSTVTGVSAGLQNTG